MTAYTPSNVHYLPPRHDEGERTQDAWALTRLSLNEAIFWINTYRRALAQSPMSATYRRHIERAHAGHCRDYCRLIRQAVEYEWKMDADGVRYQKEAQS